MCGIVGYIGNKNVARILLNGLHRLEYVVQRTVKYLSI